MAGRPPGAVRADGKKLILDPLFPYMMFENIDRYLWPYTRATST
jgi:hypothetical protein